MGQRPGFLVTRHAPAFPGSQRRNEITVEIRVFAPVGTDRKAVAEVVEDAIDETAGKVMFASWLADKED
jgi:hypothetical protein